MQAAARQVGPATALHDLQAAVRRGVGLEREERAPEAVRDRGHGAAGEARGREDLLGRAAHAVRSGGRRVRSTAERDEAAGQELILFFYLLIR